MNHDFLHGFGIGILWMWTWPVACKINHSCCNKIGLNVTIYELTVLLNVSDSNCVTSQSNKFNEFHVYST